MTAGAGCRDKDPELVKMVKRSMDVAIAEENYAYAAQLRDLPVMQMHKEIQELRRSGNLISAIQLQDELEARFAKWTFDGHAL
jgi:hypothetical protein